MRHKRAGDRRVHATARFSVNGIQRIWTACGKQVGEGGYPMNHMPVDCRDCSRATTADEAQTFVCKCPAELCHSGHHAAVSQPGKEEA